MAQRTSLGVPGLSLVWELRGRNGNGLSLVLLKVFENVVLQNIQVDHALAVELTSGVASL